MGDPLTAPLGEVNHAWRTITFLLRGWGQTGQFFNARNEARARLGNTPSEGQKDWNIICLSRACFPFKKKWQEKAVTHKT